MTIFSDNTVHLATIMCEFVDYSPMQEVGQKLLVPLKFIVPEKFNVNATVLTPYAKGLHFLCGAHMQHANSLIELRIKVQKLFRVPIQRTLASAIKLTWEFGDMFPEEFLKVTFPEITSHWCIKSLLHFIKKPIEQLDTMYYLLNSLWKKSELLFRLS